MNKNIQNSSEIITFCNYLTNPLCERLRHQDKSFGKNELIGFVQGQWNCQIVERDLEHQCLSETEWSFSPTG
jgi:hypothetical protein